MKTVRHEEYVRFEDDLPFYFQPNIVRTPKLCSTSQNWHENIELQLCLCGRGEVLLDGEKYPFEEGDVIVVPPNVIHYTTTDSSLGYACLIADNDFCESVGFDVRNVNFAPRITGNSTLNALFAELGNVFTGSDELRKPRLNLIFIKIFLELYGCRTAARTAKKAPGRFEEVKNAVVFIRENYASKLTLDDVAKAVLTDKFTLAKEFRKITGSDGDHLSERLSVPASRRAYFGRSERCRGRIRMRVRERVLLYPPLQNRNGVAPLVA